MIIIKIQGGLGNQMFQYAYGRALSVQKKTKLYLDTSHYNRPGTRAYELPEFNTNTPTASRLQILFKRPLEGYWQSEKYFIEIADIIRRELTLKEPLQESAHELANEMRDTDSVSVHIRRGDYLSPKHKEVFSVLEPEYYKKAIETMLSKKPRAKFFVFSDDITWAKELPFPKETVFLEKDLGLLAREELVLMSICRHHVIANSSFSWWGAWLGKNNDKIVIAPKNYYVDQDIDTSDWTPKTWLRM